MTSELSMNEIIQLLFSRPGEPIFMPRGDKDRIMFDVPDHFLTARHEAVREQIVEKWDKPGTITISIANTNIPDLSKVLELSKDAPFALFLESHQIIAAALIKIFMDAITPQDVISLAAYCHDRVNPYLFNYALSVALLHREDTKDVMIPNFSESFPGKFVRSTQLSSAKQEIVMPKEVRKAIVIPQNFTANLREPEQRVAYFREDLGINLHHWHWHLVYPTRASDPSIVSKDRRGELFYYMHQQVLARYNAERFCNNLARVVPLSSFRTIIPEAYFSKLVQGVAGRSLPPRFANIRLMDIDRPNDRLTLKISDLETWEKNLKEAIKNKVAKDTTGNDVSLAGDNGIDILGNMIESSIISVNRTLYGNYHNMGHILIAYCHDALGRYEEGSSIMGDTSTAMRDPIFYRWHAHINNILISLKDLSPSYTKNQLTFNNVTVTNFSVSAEGKPVNEFHTFWQTSKVDFQRGLDFAPLGPVQFEFTHLQHEPFTFTIQVTNSSNAQLVGYARIFMAPKFKENGVAMDFNEQRNFMIELDKFRVVLKKGANTLTRKSIDSSVTIPFERTFRNLDENRPTVANQLYAFNFCGCGWPQHMMVPKGTEKGAEYEMFVMISNYELDKIVQDLEGLCNDAESYCGIQDRLYPDKRNMGYPFDRKGELTVKKLSDFLTPNMKVQNVVIKFTNKIVPRATATPAITVVPATSN